MFLQICSGSRQRGAHVQTPEEHLRRAAAHHRHPAWEDARLRYQNSSTSRKKSNATLSPVLLKLCTMIKSTFFGNNEVVWEFFTNCDPQLR